MCPRSFLYVTGLALMVASVGPAVAQSGDKSQAEETASQFLRAADGSDLATVYKDLLGPSFHAQISESLFEQNEGVWRIQQGGAAKSRTLIGSQPLTFMPATGQQGTFYYVRYKTAYPNATVFQDVYLEPLAKRFKTKVECGDDICIGTCHIQVLERNRFRLSIRYGAAII